MDEKKLPFDTNFTGGAPVSPPPVFPAEKRERRLALCLAAVGILLADTVLFGGLYLGFSLVYMVGLMLSVGYLLKSGSRLRPYTAALLALALVIGAGFARSNDSGVKLVMLGLLLLSGNLGLCLLAEQNRRSPGSALTVLDAFRSALSLGVGRMGESVRGLRQARREEGTGRKGRGAVLLGLVIALPIVAVMASLLMRADAAFDGLIGLLPEVDISEPLLAVLLGLPLGLVLYTRAVALRRSEKAAPARFSCKQLNAVTRNTVLVCICGLYGLYLLSQLAYCFGGFSGILPEEYTLAEYARRGYFEMALLTGVNLMVIALAAMLSGGGVRGASRGLCLFIGAVTLLLVAAASAKMVLYIQGYGLTRLRVLTQVSMVFLGLVTVFVCIYLCTPRFPYMKAVLLLGLILGAVVLWADVDTVVAAYNVGAYQSGVMETVDVEYLITLSDGAIPYIARLTQEGNLDFGDKYRALEVCRHYKYSITEDFRGFHIAQYLAMKAAELVQ